MPIQIRDSIHGSIALSTQELELIKDPAFQRLRNIKQLGFADLAFPGATHSRYAHSLGAMEIATRIFDQLFPYGNLEESFRKQIRQTLRLATLLHDIGHPPLSHSLEAVMPSKKSLGLSQNGQATHEDYTHLLITKSYFSEKIKALFSEQGILPKHLISLDFQNKGFNYQPILKQIISSECDADRMDYLQRDSFYCGVNYGKFDEDWLISHLVPIKREQQIYLGIQSKGILSFEDFLLSRYHMFASVYLHHTPVIFEKMLQIYLEENPRAFPIPTDLEDFIRLDDIELQMHLRQSKNHWAKRIVQKNPYRLLLNELSQKELKNHCQKLTQQNISFIESQTYGFISKHFETYQYPLYVQNKKGDIIPLESYTKLFKRYKSPLQLNRIYVES